MKHKRKAVIFDLDGTLRNGQHRLHLMPPPELRGIDSAWDEFNLAAEHDEPIKDTIDVLLDLGMFNDIFILSGCGAIAERITKDWLERHGVIYDRLMMRQIGDCRVDTLVKEDMIRQLQTEGYEIRCAFDDLPHICDHFRAMGITTYEVTRYADAAEHPRKGSTHPYVAANYKQGTLK